jgi:hypothetical protein
MARIASGDLKARARQKTRNVAIKILGIGIVIACSAGGTQAATTALKPIDRVALQNTVDSLIKDLMVPGARWFCCAPRRASSLSVQAQRSWASPSRRVLTRISGSPRIPRR